MENISYFTYTGLPFDESLVKSAHTSLSLFTKNTLTPLILKGSGIISQFLGSIGRKLITIEESTAMPSSHKESLSIKEVPEYEIEDYDIEEYY